MYKPSFPLQFSRGPTPCKIIFVTDSWGQHEEKLMRPLVGSSGLELARMLYEAGIISENLPHKYLQPAQLDAFWQNHNIFMTNVLPLRPPTNKILSLCDNKKEVGGKNYTHPPLELGKYLRPEYLPELDRLAEEIRLCQPNIIVALGNVACWALLRRTVITSIRGTTSECLLVPGVKVLPTFHPSRILSQWKNRPIMVADLIKAQREMEFPEIVRPKREIIVNPSLEEIEDYYNQLAELVVHGKQDESQSQLMSIDIETKATQITMISFSVSEDKALVIPFYDESLPGGNYWQDIGDEIKAWFYVKKLLDLPIAKLYQSGLYDIQYLFRAGFRPVNCLHDTMLLHHAILPEMKKDLGFLGSIYTNESSWKLMRRVRAKELSNKSDE